MSDKILLPNIYFRIAVALLIPLNIYSKSLTFEYNQDFYDINYQIIDGFNYFNLNDLQLAFGFNVSCDSIRHRWIVEYQGKKVVLIPDNPWITINSKLLNMPVAPKVAKDMLWLPIPVLNEVIGYFLSQNIHIEGDKLSTYRIGMRIEKIVIDPGHGGHDSGAVGHKGLKEKDVVLDIAKKVVKLIESELGITCIITRDIDTFISLLERTKIANQCKADLFLSIHCNYASSKERCGTEVYFLSPAKTTWERAVEARENASLKYELPEYRGEVEAILWDMAQTEFLKESNFLAGKLVSLISTSASTYNRGVKQANFFVLRGTYMPACLIEVAFISNTKGEENLRNEDFRAKIATGIVKGVQEFKKWYEEQMNY
ncbi:MAG: N-acetylmuramoyl-L-alanine amidase [bacterium]|nr:N-acetylmuramoyl-L-alanine amidase [bacterium]